MESSRLLELSAIIAENTRLVHETLQARNLPQPSFKPDGPLAAELPADLAKAQDAILDATAELHDLFLSPMDLFFHHGAHNNLVCIQAIVRFGIAQLFSPEEKVTYRHVAERIGVQERLVRRLLMHAATMRIFDCSEEGKVGHTRASAELRRNEVSAWMGVASDHMWPAATKVVDALQKWPSSDEPNQTGFALAQPGPATSIYGAMTTQPGLAGSFQAAMAAYASQPGMSAAHITSPHDGWSWAALPEGARVVDLGGGRGHIAVPLAERYPALRVTVQDIPPVVAGAEGELPPHLREGGRVRFEPHDLFAEQGEAAECFYLRWVLHNWADSYAVKILRTLTPVLRKGDSVVVQDIVAPEVVGVAGGLPLWKEKMVRAADMNMLGVFNSYERTVSDWKALFAAADARFVLDRIIEPAGSTLAIIVVRWNA